MSSEIAQKPTGRLLSIDALRGFDMFWIVGGEELIKAIAERTHSRAGHAIVEQLEHVEWQGFRFYDLIFPLFLFLVGTVLPFSLGRIEQSGRAAAFARIARRTAMLFLLGLIYNKLLQFDFANLRVAGVLQRIAICYGVAAVICLNTRVLGQVILLLAILIGYWALLTYVAAPGGIAGDLSKETNLAGWVDRHFLPGKIYQAYYGFGDNEGLLSTIPAVGTALLGVLAGQVLRSGASPSRKILGLLTMGAACLGAGWSWSFSFPLIKNLWTSSFVLVAGGFSLILLALFYAVIDVIGWKRWAFFFVVIGSNAITIYLASSIVDFASIAQFFLGGTIRLSGGWGPVVLAAGVIAVEWVFLLFLYRNKIYLRV